jgi:hypothetical protein
MVLLGAVDPSRSWLGSQPAPERRAVVGTNVQDASLLRHSWDFHKSSKGKIGNCPCHGHSMKLSLVMTMVPFVTPSQPTCNWAGEVMSEPVSRTPMLEIEYLP